MRFFSADRHRGGGTLIEGLEQLEGLRNAERYRSRPRPSISFYKITPAALIS